MRISTLIALTAMSIAAAAPALAADPMMKKDNMSSGSMMQMSAAETRKMKMCNAMPHDKMMKNASCVKMMKMHPDMMKHDGGMMKSDGMMKHDSMK